MTTHPATIAPGQTWQVTAADGEPAHAARTIVAITETTVTFTNSDYPGKPFTFSRGAFMRWASRAVCINA